ncbi:MAG: histidinol-phosphatase HisJ family protein [Clostridiaceae bacterium]|nr:histidinol-phosphatase HisJ family protein [Clostridiaceae bacterium]
MFIDSHSHTKHFSGDARMNISDLISGALSASLKAVVITEHYDDDYPHKIDTPMTCDIESYYESFQQWLTQSPPSLELRFGIEMGYQSGLVNRYNNIVQNYPFDSVIMSSHLIYGIDPYLFRDCYDLGPKELYSKYISDLVEIASGNCNFDILGHYDYISRYAPYKDCKMYYDICPDEFDTLFRAMINSEKSLEINTRSISKLRSQGHDNPMPDDRILLRYKELGGTIISLGSDAHSPDGLGQYFNETRKFLKQLGFDILTSYKNRKPQMTVL